MARGRKTMPPQAPADRAERERWRDQKTPAYKLGRATLYDILLRQPTPMVVWRGQGEVESAAELVLVAANFAAEHVLDRELRRDIYARYDELFPDQVEGFGKILVEVIKDGQGRMIDRYPDAAGGPPWRIEITPVGDVVIVTFVPQFDEE